MMRDDMLQGDEAKVIDEKIRPDNCYNYIPGILRLSETFMPWF